MSYPKKFLIFLLVVPLVLSLSSCQSSQPFNTTEQKTPLYDINTADCASKLKHARNLYSELESYDSNDSESPDFLTLFNQLEIVIDNGYSKAQLQSSVHPDIKIREQADACIQEFSSIYTNLGLSRPVYDTLSNIDISTVMKLGARYGQTAFGWLGYISELLLFKEYLTTEQINYWANYLAARYNIILQG